MACKAASNQTENSAHSDPKVSLLSCKAHDILQNKRTVADEFMEVKFTSGQTFCSLTLIMNSLTILKRIDINKILLKKKNIGNTMLIILEKQYC